MPRRSFATAWSGRDLPPTVRRLGAASFFQDVASEMVYPLLPAFLVALGGGPALLGTMESAAEAVLALVKRWTGRASDRLRRRKPFVVAGYAASALARPLLALAAAASQVVALRLWDRLAKGIRTAPRDALIADAASADARAAAFAFHRGLDHLGAAVGPLLAGLWLALDPGATRAVFAAATLPALAGVAIVAFSLPAERVRTAAAVASAPEPAAPGRTPRRLLAAFFLAALARASEAFLLLRGAAIGAGPGALAVGWSMLHLLKWGAAAPAGRFADRIGPGRALAGGWVLHAVAFAGFAFVPGAVGFAALLPVYAASTGLVEGSERAVAVAGRPGAGSGTALGAYHAATGFGAAASSAAFGLVWETFSPAAAFLAASFLALAAVPLLPRLRSGAP